MGEYDDKIGRFIIHYHDVTELQLILNIRRIMSEWYSLKENRHSLKDFFNNRIALTKKYDHAFLIKEIIADNHVIGLQICWINPMRSDGEPFVTVEDIELKRCE